MTNVHKSFSDNELVSAILEGIQEVKGHEIVVLDLRSIPHAVSDFFVVCHGNSHTQVKALIRSVEETVEESTGDRPWNKEGLGNASWALLDYSDVVVHIFYKEDREFYALEELWADAESSLIESRA